MNSNDIQKQLAKLRRNKKFLWLGILLFVLVVLWILVSIFATTKTSAIPKELRDLSQSFVPRLESKVFDEIADKRAFSKEELDLFSIYVFSKSDLDGSDTPIDIIIDPNADKQPIQETETATQSSDLAEPNIEVGTNVAEVDSVVATDSSSPEEASTSSMNVPQSVSDFLDYMTKNN